MASFVSSTLFLVVATTGAELRFRIWRVRASPRPREEGVTNVQGRIETDRAEQVVEDAFWKGVTRAEAEVEGFGRGLGLVMLVQDGDGKDRIIDFGWVV